MPTIHVCPLSEVARTVRTTDASHLVTLLNEGTFVERPASITAHRHLFLGINDITMPIDGMVPPREEHLRQLIGFVESWDRTRPVVVHCFAGISRSTAAAFVALCALRPDRDERDIAKHLRALSPMATPNPLMVRIADDILGRGGRMVVAIEAIGSGAEAFQGRPFALPLAG